MIAINAISSHLKSVADGNVVVTVSMIDTDS